MNNARERESHRDSEKLKVGKMQEHRFERIEGKKARKKGRERGIEREREREREKKKEKTKKERLETLREIECPTARQ